MVVINRDDAVAIFRAKFDRTGSRSQLSTKLSEKYEITPRAVRDIWNLRTWAHATMPYWTTKEHNRFLLMSQKIEAQGMIQNHTSVLPDHDRAMRRVEGHLIAQGPSRTLQPASRPPCVSLVWSRMDSTLDGLLEEALALFSQQR
jgi:hypothetical protein